jgi:hypothetical protein
MQGSPLPGSESDDTKAQARQEITMSQIVSEILAANANYVSQFGEKGKLALPPARRFAILTCMDARLDPAKYAVFPRAMPMSFATPAAARVTMRSVRW